MSSSADASAAAKAKLKAVRAKLVAAKTALGAGDAHAARASCREALALDDGSHDAWVFDGKAALATGDAEGAADSFRAAITIRADSPHARLGVLEAAETLGDQALAADALAALLGLPEDGKQVTPEARVGWRERRAKALEALERWAEARDATRAVAEDAARADANADANAEANADAPHVSAFPGTRFRAATIDAARFAMLAEEAALRRERDAAKAALRAAKGLASASDLRAAAARAARRVDASPNEPLEACLRALSALPSARGLASASDRSGDPVDVVDLATRGALLLLRRASARLSAARGSDAAGSAAVETLAEAEALLAGVEASEGTDDASAGTDDASERERDASRDASASASVERPSSLAARRAARDAALEAAAALDAGWDVEEEGWEAEAAFAEESAALAARVAAILRAASPSEGGALEGFDPRDPAGAVAAAWTRASDAAAPSFAGRSGRVANVPGSVEGASVLPAPVRAALRAALGHDADAAVAAAATAAEAAEAAKAPRLAPGARVLGWGAEAEAALCAGEPAEALDAARRCLASLRELRDAEDGAEVRGAERTGHVVGNGTSSDGTSSGSSPPPSLPRAPMAERRARLVAAEALSALGSFGEAASAFAALARAGAPESPRVARGLAALRAADASREPSAATRRAEALALLKKAAALAPKAPRPLAELGWAMLENGGEGSAGRARRALERSAELCGGGGGARAPEPPEGIAPAAAAESSRAEPSSSGRSGAPVVESIPPDVSARLGIARWRDSGDLDSRGAGSARAAFLAAASRPGTWRASAFAHLALAYRRAGDETRAAKCRAKALALDPADPVAGPAECAAAHAAYAAAGFARVSEEDEREDEREEASGASGASSRVARVVRRVCRAALAAAPGCVWAAACLAPIAHAEGRHDEAAAAWRAVLRAAPRCASAWEALGATYDDAGKRSAARKAYREATLRAAEERTEPRALAKNGPSAHKEEKRTARSSSRTFADVRGEAVSRALGVPFLAPEEARARDAARDDAEAAASASHPASSFDAAERALVEARVAARQGATHRAAALASEAAESARRGARAAAGSRAPCLRSAAKLEGDARLLAANARRSPDDFFSPAASEAQKDLDVGRASTRRAAFDARLARSAYARLARADPGDASARGDLAAASESEAAALDALGDARPAAALRRVAERSLRAGLRLDPADPALWTALGTLPLGDGSPADDDDEGTRTTFYTTSPREFARRESALCRATALAPRRAAAWSALGALYLRAADEAARDEIDSSRASLLRAAELALDRARAADPDDAAAWIGTADAARARGDADSFAGAARVASRLRGGGRDADLRRALADVATKRAAFLGGAIAAAARARCAAPLDPAAALADALAREARGETDAARDAFAASLRLADAARERLRLGRDGSAVEREARAGIERAAERGGGGGVEDDAGGSLFTPRDEDGGFAEGLDLAAAARGAMLDPGSAETRGAVARVAAARGDGASVEAAARVVPVLSLPRPTPGPEGADADLRAAAAAFAASLAATPPPSPAGVADPGGAFAAARDAAARGLAKAARARPGDSPAFAEVFALMALAETRRARGDTSATAESRARVADRLAAFASADPRVGAALAAALRAGGAAEPPGAAAPHPHPHPRPPGSSVAARLEGALLRVARGEARDAEGEIRDVSRACAAEARASRMGAQPGATAAARALLGAALLSRGDAKAAKEAGKVLAGATRGTVAGSDARKNAAAGAAMIRAAGGIVEGG